MALTEKKVIDQVTVDEHGNVLVREATRVLRNGEVISTTYHRTSYGPDDTIPADADPKVRAIAEAARGVV